MGSTGS